MTTTLYRFFAADDTLLYVGITGRHVTRWVEHAGSKPWWPDVARTTVEHHDTRAEALAAEKRAIQIERPLHNVVHANRSPQPAPEVPMQPTTNYPVKVGEVVVIRRLSGGTPPVGYVDEVTDFGVKIALYSFMSGYFGHSVILVRWDDVAEMAWCPLVRGSGNDREFDMDRAGDFQRRWSDAAVSA